MILRIETDFRAALNALGKLARRFTDVREAWPSVTDLLRRIIERQFASQGSAGTSGAWKPLASPYAEWKASRFPGQPILRASDRMFRSLVEQGGENILEETPNSLTFGTSVPYARFHQDGTDRMAARRIFDLGPQDEDKLAQEMQRQLGDYAAELGFEVRK